MILVEITAAVDAAGTLRTFYASNGEYATLPTDTPANQAFSDVLDDPGDIGLNVYGDSRTGGTGVLDVGSLRLVNDGQFDPWLDYGFDGRQIVIRLHDPEVPYASMKVLFTGTVDSPPLVTRKHVTLRLRDLQQVLEVPASPDLYLGNNVLPAGIEGTPDDLKGKTKPRVFGSVFEMQPDCVNTDETVYRVNNGAVHDIPAVYDRGVLITKGSDYATSTALFAAPYSPGVYHTCFAEGLFKLSAPPNGMLTANVVEGATAAARTTAQIVKRLMAVAGVGAFDAASVTQLDVDNSAEVGICIKDNKTVRAAASEILQSIGAYAVFDATGVVRMGRLQMPSGDPLGTVTRSQVLNIERVVPRDGDQPVWRVTTQYAKLYTVQTSDLAGSVNSARKAYLSQERRNAEPASDVSVKTQFLLAEDYVMPTLLVYEADARTEAVRQLTLYKQRRNMYQITIPLEAFGNIALGREVLIKYPRFGLNTGELFVVLGIKLELGRNRVILTVWG